MPDNLESRIAAVERLTKLFQLERLVHLLATGVAVAILLVTAIVMLIKKEASAGDLTMLFGSTGIIGYTANRLLVMWTKSMEIVLTASSGTET